jgi:hypothetical protein
MVTLDQLKTLRHGDILHYGECSQIIGPRGGCRIFVEHWRVSGKPIFLKRDPLWFSLPIKYGMYQSARLTPSNACDFHLACECPLASTQKGA